MKKITTVLMACAIVFNLSAQIPSFSKKSDDLSGANPESLLISKAKKSVEHKINGVEEPNRNDDSMQKLDSIYLSENDKIFGKLDFTYNELGQNTQYSSLSDVMDDGEMVEEERIEYFYNENGLENNRFEYAFQGNDLEKSAETAYFYDEDDRLDSMSMLMLIDGELMQIEANVIYNAQEQVSSTIMFSDIFNNDDLERVHQIDYYYADQVLDSVTERTLEQDLTFVWKSTKSFEYNNTGDIEEVYEERNTNTASRDEYSYTTDGYVDEILFHYKELDTWQIDAKVEFTYLSNEEVISPILFQEEDVNFLDYGKISEYIISMTSGSDWEAMGVGTFYYSSLGTGISNNEIVNDYFTMYPNPTNGELTINLSGEGNHEVQVFNMSGQLVANELLSAQQTIDLSTIESGYYFVQVSQNGVTLGTKKLIKQ